MSKPDVSRLAEAVRSRREYMHLAQADLRSRGGPGVVTVGKIERGSIPNPSGITLAKLDAALAWRHGSARHILEGGEPLVWEGLEVRSDEVLEKLGLPTQGETRFVGPEEEDADLEVLFRLPPGLSPRQRETAIQLGRQSVQTYLDSLREE